MGREYRTNRGQYVNLDELLAKSDRTVALNGWEGPITNARGDTLGRGGQIVLTREQVVQEYFAKAPTPVRNVSIKDVIPDDFFETPDQAMSRIKSQQKANVAPQEVPVEDTPKKRKIIEKED